MSWLKRLFGGVEDEPEYESESTDGALPYGGTYYVDMKEHPNSAPGMRWEWTLVRRNTGNRSFNIPTIHTIGSGWAGSEEQGEAKAKLAKERYIKELNARTYTKEI